MTPLQQIISALAMAKKVWPKIIGTWEYGFSTNLLWRTIKMTGK